MPPAADEPANSRSPDPAIQRIVQLVRAIPPGRVASYGQIARLAGKPRGARMVAWALHSMRRKHDLPWQRVINSKGTISLPAGTAYNRQRSLLVAEGVEFLPGDRIDWKRFGWDPEAADDEQTGNRRPAVKKRATKKARSKSKAKPGQKRNN